MAIVRQLHKKDNRSDFCSGNLYLDNFFVQYAGQNQFKHYIGTTYVAVENDKILGYTTVSASQIEFDELPESTNRKRLPQYPLPILLRMARLAVDKKYQKKGIGLLLLKTVFQIAWEMAEKVGCVGVLVDSKLEAVDFYKSYGFIELDEKGLNKDLKILFISIKYIPKLKDKQ